MGCLLRFLGSLGQVVRPNTIPSVDYIDGIPKAGVELRIWVFLLSQPVDF